MQFQETIATSLIEHHSTRRKEETSFDEMEREDIEEKHSRILKKELMA